MATLPPASPAKPFTSTPVPKDALDFLSSAASVALPSRGMMSPVSFRTNPRLMLGAMGSPTPIAAAALASMSRGKRTVGGTLVTPPQPVREAGDALDSAPVPVDDSNGPEFASKRRCIMEAGLPERRGVKVARVVADADNGGDYVPGSTRKTTPTGRKPSSKVTPLARPSSSQFIGVSWSKSSNSWISQLYHDSKKHYIGSFPTEKDAAIAYDKLARKLKGPSVRTNFNSMGQPNPLPHMNNHHAGPAKATPKPRAAPKAKAKSASKPKAKSAPKRGGGANKGTRSSRFLGVSWSRSGKRWVAQLYHDSKKHYIGCFSEEVDAAKAYDELAKKIKGVNAPTNFTADGFLARPVGSRPVMPQVPQPVVYASAPMTNAGASPTAVPVTGFPATSSPVLMVAPVVGASPIGTFNVFGSFPPATMATTPVVAAPQEPRFLTPVLAPTAGSSPTLPLSAPVMWDGTLKRFEPPTPPHGTPTVMPQL